MVAEFQEPTTLESQGGIVQPSQIQLSVDIESYFSFHNFAQIQEWGL